MDLVGFFCLSVRVLPLSIISFFILHHIDSDSTKLQEPLKNLFLALVKLVIPKSKKLKWLSDGLFDCGALFRAFLRTERVKFTPCSQWSYLKDEFGLYLG